MFTYELTLLSPLFYRTRQDSGAAGSTTTDPWVGDLALCYAINQALGLKEFRFGYESHRPDYTELRELPFTTSVAVPSGEVRRTQVYDIATNFMSEGYTNYRAQKKTENAPMRNWLKRQGLAPGNQFRFAIASKDGWEPPKEFSVRLGNTLECHAVCRKMELPLGKVTANAYTLKALFGVKSDEGIKFEAVEKPMAQYILLHGVAVENWLSLVIPYS